MPAYFDSGFCVRTPSWHREEILLDDYPADWTEARKIAGLEWEPRIVPMFHQVQQEMISGDAVTVGPQFIEVPDFRIVERDDTHAVLGPVSDGYGIVTHEAMGEIVDAIVGEGAKFETAGCVKGGAQVYCLVYLDEPYTIPGDDTETLPFLAVLNSHDGSGACKVVATQVRVVCWNTYQAASMSGDRSGRQFTFRHTAKVLDRIEDAKNALSGLRDEQHEWIALATELGGLQASETAFNHFLSEFIPEPPKGLISDRVKANVDKAHEIFRQLYMESVTTDAHRGTALGLVHAATEYADHIRGFRNTDSYLSRTMLRPEPLKAKAVTLARRVCK